MRPLLLLLPSLLCLGAFTYWPIASVAVDSLFGRRLGEKTSEFAGIGNYLRLAADAKFLAAAGNNLFYAALTVLPSVLLALAFALLLQRSTRFTAPLRARKRPTMNSSFPSTDGLIVPSRSPSRAASRGRIMNIALRRNNAFFRRIRHLQKHYCHDFSFH